MKVREQESIQKQDQKEKMGRAYLPSKQMVKVLLDHAAEEDQANSDHAEQKFGTVGCVALYYPGEKSL